MMTSFPPFISVGPRRRRPPGVNARRYHSPPTRTGGLDFAAWEWKEEKDLTFADRADAGRRLLPLLGEWRAKGEVTVIGVPKGGVPVAAEVARALKAPLGIWVAMRISAPNRPRLSVGTVGEDGDLDFCEDTLRKYGVPLGYLVDEVRYQRAETARRASVYRPEEEPLDIFDRHVVVVDDGAASGGTLRAVLRGLKHRKPASITVALPVMPQRLAREFSATGATVHSLTRPLSVSDIGQFYRAFPEVTDEDVLATLGK